MRKRLEIVHARLASLAMPVKGATTATSRTAATSTPATTSLGWRWKGKISEQGDVDMDE